MTFDLGLVTGYLPELALAAATTFGIWIAGSLTASLLGFSIALARWWGGWIINAPLLLAVEIVRGTPFLVQLFILYFGGPFIGISLNPLSAGLLGLTIYGSAYFAEIFRAGLVAVPRGHVESAGCLGLTRPQIVRRILLPEMTMLVLPPSVNLLIVLIKETAVLSIITVPELTLVITGIGSKYYAFAEALFLLALFYWGLVELASRLGRLAETRLAKYTFAR
ncbi:MAG: amino acid ABC transporter permease [Alphaproteobacteria bacterium]|nr:amino acid ABC transporter permease [Alphaproteobacteria bacterium]